MSAGSLVAFNLLLNAIGSFAVGYALSRAVLPLFRRTPGKLTMLVVALPFAKVAFDVARGIPADSFLWLRARGASQDLGSFMVGVGVHLGVPKIDFSFGALHDGRTYGQSAADLAGVAVSKLAGAYAPLAVVVVLGAVAVIFLVRRALDWQTLRRRRATLEAARPIAIRAGARGSVRVLHDPEASTPYTGGVLSPFIALPPGFAALPDDERDAALAHELGHVAEHHVFFTTLIGAMSDLFWFVPGIRRARRTFHASCEASADRWAVARGIDPVVLASALVRCHELASQGGNAPRASLAATGATVTERVERLLDDAPLPRFALARPGPRLIIAAWSTAAVLSAVAFGNH